MSKIGLSQLKNVDMGMITQMFKQFDKNFSTLATNQIYIQENQVEFEKYLKDIQKCLSNSKISEKEIFEYLKAILKNQEMIMEVINKGNTQNIIKQIEE